MKTSRDVGSAHASSPSVGVCSPSSGELPGVAATSRGMKSPGSHPSPTQVPPPGEAGDGTARGTQSPWSRIIQAGVNACDGWPKCRYEGRGHDLRDHRRHCAYSDTGALWRLFHTGAGL